MAKLQSQIFRTCIDACNECFEACEICAVKCLHEENVNPLARCVEIYITCYHACAASSAVMSAESAYALRYAKLVQKSVRSILIWIIVSNVLRYVASVQKNVAGFQSNNCNLICTAL